jgi:hypothetical protein
MDGIEPIVAELEATHRQMRCVGSQDFEVYSLYLGLSAIGDERRGANLLQDYVLQHRRSKYPLHPSMAAVAAQSNRRRPYHNRLGQSDYRKRGAEDIQTQA